MNSFTIDLVLHKFAELRKDAWLRAPNPIQPVPLQVKGVPRRFTPILKGVREELTGGAYTLVLEFEKKPGMPAEDFTSRQDKFQNFFGPGITADLKETEQVSTARYTECSND